MGVDGDGVSDFLIFISYMCIPLEIFVVVGLAYRNANQSSLPVGRRKKTKSTAALIIILLVAVLFISFIIACGITHLINFLQVYECVKAEMQDNEFCIGRHTGVYSRTSSAAKAVTAFVSVATAVVLALLLKPLVGFASLYALVEDRVQDVEDALRVMLNSTDAYSTLERQSLRLRSVSDSGRWMFESLGLADESSAKGYTLLDVVVEEDKARIAKVFDSRTELVEPRPRAKRGRGGGNEERDAEMGMAQSLLPPTPECNTARSSVDTCGGLETHTVEYRIKRAEGEGVRWVESSFVHDDVADVVHVVTRDIDSRREEEQQRAAAKEMENQQATVQRWVHYMSCVAHDLRTPLTCFEMALEEINADREHLSDEAHHALKHATASCGVLRGTVTQAIDVRASVASGFNPTPRKGDVSMKAIMQTLKGMVPALSVGNIVQVIFEIRADVPKFIVCDQSWLVQMMLNLLSNSCKYTVQGSVTVRCLATNQGRTLRVEVQDTGVGMREEASKNLFEPFYQAQKASGSGTGLGLYSVRMHAEALGGRCGYLPAQPHGSIFFFEVPLIPAETEGTPMFEAVGEVVESPLSSAAMSQQQRAPAALSDNAKSALRGQHSPILQRVKALNGATPSGGGAGRRGSTDTDASSPDRGQKVPASPILRRSRKTISAEEVPEIHELQASVKRALVVDDVCSIRKLLPARLRRLCPEMTVEIAENGQAGLEMILDNGPFDLVVSDVVMPVLSGPEMVLRLREHEREHGSLRTPVVGMSANTSAQDVDEYLKNGMDAFMYKPMPSDAREITLCILKAVRLARKVNNRILAQTDSGGSDPES